MSLLDDAKATPKGKLPTVIVLTTVLVEVLITETLLEPSLATYMSLLDGAKATPIGTLPTDIVGYAAWVTRFKLMTENRRIPINADKRIKCFLFIIFLFSIFHSFLTLFLRVLACILANAQIDNAKNMHRTSRLITAPATKRFVSRPKCKPT